MKILMISNTYTPVVGGLEKSIQTFTDEFRRLGHKVTIVAPEMEGAPKNEFGVVRLPAIQKVSGTEFSINLPLPGILSELVEYFKPDVIHAHHPFFIGDMALRIRSQYQIPLIYTYHTMFDQYSYHLPFLEDALKNFLVELSINYSNLTDCVIAPSASVREILTGRGVKTPIYVVPTGIDVQKFEKGNPEAIKNKFKIPKSAFVVGHAGRLSPEKGLDFLALCVSKSIAEHKNAHFLVVGDGPSKETIEKTFKELQIENQLHFTGILKGQKLIDAYHAMDVFAFSSESETQGMVVTEAMAAGVPVVGLDAPGVREVIHDKQNGRLIFGKNTEQFKEAFDWCINQNKKSWESVRKKALRTAKEFSIEETTASMLRVYRAAKKKIYTPPEIEKSAWDLLMGRIQAEWHILTSVAKATTAAITETVKGESPK